MGRPPKQRNFSSAFQSRSSSKEPPLERLKRRSSFTLDRLAAQPLPWMNGRSNSTPQAEDEAEVQQQDPKQRPHKSFSGLGSVKSGIGSKLRRTSENIRSKFQSSNSKNDSAAVSTKRQQASPPSQPTTDKGNARRSRPTTQGGDIAAQLAAMSLNHSSLEKEITQSLTSSRDPSRGAAARASAARENQRNNTPKTISRRDSNVGISRVERSRESGISMHNDTNGATDTKDRRDSHVLRIDPLAYLPTELNSLILSFLDAGSLTEASLVSKQWRRMASDQHVWRTVFLRKFGQNMATSSPPACVGGKGVGKSSRAEQDWKQMYKARHHLAWYWRRGDPTAAYLRGHTDSVYCLQFDEDKIITGSRDRTIRVWDIRTLKCLKVIGIPSAYNNDCREAANAEDPLPIFQAMAIYQSLGKTPDPNLYHVPAYYHQASILCLQYDDEIVVTGSSDNTLIVWDIRAWQPIRRLLRHRSGVLDVAFDKQKIVSCSKDASLCIWDRATGDLLQQLTGHRGPVNAVQLRGDLIVSASGEGCARLWNLANGAKCVKEFWSRDRGLACVEFSADAKYILAGGNDQVIYKFDTTTGETVATLPGHENLVRSLYLDGANGRVISGSYDLSLRVWDFESGELLARFADATTSWLLAAKSDYRRIVCTSQDGRVVVLDFGWFVPGVNLLEG